ncbi:MAG: protein-tyrosine phosphatase [Bacteroidia bacterium]
MKIKRNFGARRVGGNWIVSSSINRGVVAHQKNGQRHMRIYWINELRKPGKLGIMPRPKGGEWLSDEIKSLVQRNISTVVSHLETIEEIELDISSERRQCIESGIKFISYPIPDRDLPKDLNSYLDLITEINSKLENGENVIIHCRMGIGRTGITAASVMIKNGWKTEQAFKLLSELRTLEMPDTKEQIEFVEKIKEALQQRI